MIYQIKNDELQVEINSLGAELWSIRDRAGKEYLWQGEESTGKTGQRTYFLFAAG